MELKKRKKKKYFKQNKVENFKILALKNNTSLCYLKIDSIL